MRLIKFDEWMALSHAALVEAKLSLYLMRDEGEITAIIMIPLEWASIQNC